MLVIAAVIIYITYSFLLRGNFENLIISVFQNIFGMDYDAALDLYQRTFRSHMDTILLLSMLFVFIALFHVYLRWFTRYFEEVNRGMDALLQDTPGEISLAPELLSIERKMNMAKHTIDRQKSDMLMAEQRKNDLVMYLAHDLKTRWLPQSAILIYCGTRSKFPRNCGRNTFPSLLLRQSALRT